MINKNNTLIAMILFIAGCNLNSFSTIPKIPNTSATSATSTTPQETPLTTTQETPLTTTQGTSLTTTQETPLTTTQGTTLTTTQGTTLTTTQGTPLTTTQGTTLTTTQGTPITTTQGTPITTTQGTPITTTQGTPITTTQGTPITTTQGTPITTTQGTPITTTQGTPITTTQGTPITTTQGTPITTTQGTTLTTTTDQNACVGTTFNGTSSGQTLENGLVANLNYMTNKEDPKNTQFVRNFFDLNLQNFLDPFFERVFNDADNTSLTLALIKTTNSLFFNELNYPTQPFISGFHLKDNQTINYPGTNKKLIGYFNLNFNFLLSLPEGYEPGYYQLAIISDDGATAQLTDFNGNVLKNSDNTQHYLLQNDGTHSAKLVYSHDFLYFADRNTRIPIQLNYMQSAPHQIALMLFWRKYNPRANSAPEAVSRIPNVYSGARYLFACIGNNPKFPAVDSNGALIENRDSECIDKRNGVLNPDGRYSLISTVQGNSLTANTFNFTYPTLYMATLGLGQPMINPLFGTPNAGPATAIITKKPPNYGPFEIIPASAYFLPKQIKNPCVTQAAQ